MISLLKTFKPLILTIIIISSNIMYSQSYNTSSRRAIKYFQKAHQEFLNKNYQQSLPLIDKALKIDAEFSDAYLLKAELCLEINKDSLAIQSYERIFEIDSMTFPKCAVSLSKLYTKSFQFDKSIALLNWFLSLANQKDVLVDIARHHLELTRFRKTLVENKQNYNPINIGDVVNTSADEYVNQYYVNENKIIFTKRNQNEIQGLFFDENVYVTERYDSIWSIPRLLLEGLKDIGAANISYDGNEIYFSASSWKDGFGSCDIYFMRYEDGRWTEPQNIESINTSEWESQPCLSYDGKELYFVRGNRKTSTSDIFVSKRDVDMNWTTPVKLNSNVNTAGNEMAPFIHHDGMTLYFSSDGHLGMGGFDLFVSRRDHQEEWKNAWNLGYPLNTDGDEINIVVSNDATKAYMSANRNDGYGAFDIYEFDLNDDFKPKMIEIEKPSDDILYAETLNKQGSVVLKSIYFRFDSADLTADSEEGIDAVYDYLNSNSDKSITLVGHTDDMGDDNYNLRLSEKRAENIKTALINKGISSDRILTIGYGASSPLVPNDNEEHRALNRRVEMKLNK